MAENKRLIPHFVADRPMSLRILAGLDLAAHPVKFGIMLQACGSENYRNMVSRFPCMEMEYCTVIQGKCPFNGDIYQCESGLRIKRLMTTIADSGVFTKNGSSINYFELFNRYEMMKVERGIILDVLRDLNCTIQSAKKGMKIFSQGNYSFNLIGVAQGRNPEEYRKCYEKLKKIGYSEIAIGGFLTKKLNTARYAHSNKDEIASVVKSIKSEWPDDRCFVLGVYNPKRHDFLEALGVDAADYKGWIFQYERNYEDPHSHHFDRIIQTRYFIEKNILSCLSGQKPREQTIRHINQYMKSNIRVNGNRVYINNKNNGSNFNDHKEQIIVISCGKKKNHVVECNAKDAYIGTSFRLKRKYAELSGRPWLILSAKYGFLHPDDKINPNYNQTIATKKDINYLESIIRNQIRIFFEKPKHYEINFLGPLGYAAALNKAFEDNSEIKIFHLTEGLTQGKTLQRINKLIKSEMDQNRINYDVEH